MSNIKLTFLGEGPDNSVMHSLNCYVNQESQIRITIDNGYHKSCIHLDKPTAVSLVKELKRNISFLNNEQARKEVKNGK